MLSLRIDNRKVHLPVDFSMTMNLKSPLFDNIGSYSYPFRIPATPANMIRFGFPHRPANTSSLYRDFRGEFNWNDLGLFSGNISLSTLSNRSYEGSIVDGTGDFNYQLKNNYLQQYDFGDQEFVTENDAMDWINGCKNYLYPDRPCAFPEVYNNKYFEEEPADPEMLSYNFYSRVTGRIHTLSTTYQRCPIVPMLYLRYVLDKLFDGMGYKLEDNFFTANAAFNKLVLYNSVSINNPTPGLFPYSVFKLYYNNHVPRIKLSDFITGIETFFNIRFYPDNFTRTIRIISLQNVITKKDYKDWAKNIMSITVLSEEQIKGYKLKMELDGDDPEFEALTAYEDQFMESFKGSVETYADLPAWPNADDLDIRYVIGEEKYYRMVNRVWEEILPNVIDDLKTQYLYKDGSMEVSTKVSPLIQGVSTNYCSCKNKQVNFRDITPRIFFAEPGYYGDLFYVNGYNYNPFAGSLLYPGPTGLFEKYFREWISWRMETKAVRIMRQLDYKDIREFRFDDKIMIQGTRYMVKSIQIPFKKDRIMPATLECLIAP